MVGVEKVMPSPLVARLVAGMPNFTREEVYEPSYTAEEV